MQLNWHDDAMHSTILCLFVVVIVCQSSSCQREKGGGSSYIAAVYEHKVILNSDPGSPVSREAALEHMWKNLDVYEEQAARAAQQVGH